MTPGYFRRAMCPTTLRRALVPEPAMHHRSSCLALLLALILSACASTSHPSAGIGPSLEGDALRPAAASGWIRSELYFGVGRDDAPSDRPNTDTIDEAAWRRFLDQEVTPRFPDGLTVLDGYGQWLFRGEPEPHRLRSKVLVVLHEDTPQRRADIEAIRLAWKQATGHQSVLWARQPAEVSF